MKDSKHTVFLSLLALATLALPSFAPAQLPVTSGTHTFNTTVTYSAPTRQAVDTTANILWAVTDGVTVTISDINTASSGGVISIGGAVGNNTIFTIAPAGSTGRIIFQNNTTSDEGSIFYQNRASIDITNVSFIGNGSTKAAVHGGGVFRIGSTALSTKLTNVLFDKNYAFSLGGAIRTLHGISVTSGTFTSNYASGTTTTTGFGGAIAATSGGLNLNNNGIQVSVITESYFAGNWASRYGGAIGVDGSNPYHSFTYWDHIGFDNNFAGLGGGAIYDIANTDLLISGERHIQGQRFVFTGTTGITDYVYSGNIARGVALTADEITAARNGSFAFTATAAASAGGFYFSNIAGSQLHFDIAENVTVSIGQAGNPSAWDSIANSDASGTSARIALTGTDANGGGTLVLHADNSYFQGAVNVDKGALLLGNQNAKLGGFITVAGGATFGGAGELITHRQNGTLFAGRTKLTAGDNAHIQIGTDTAVDAETLTIAGDLVAGAGVTFTHDLFTSGSASLLRVENLSLAGTGTINLGLLATGSFTLMEWIGTGLAAGDLSSLSLTVDGASNNSRSTAELSLSANQLVVTNTVNNLIMKWTGAEGISWTRRPSIAQKNWADTGGSDESKFYNADTVVFDSVADAASAGSREITIEAGGVVVSGMEVSGTARYVFLGEGGIEADGEAVGSAAFTPSGKLKKSGEGELIFANTATNTFQGGIEISGGLIGFDNAAQLGSGTGGITFTESATLRAASTITGTLADNVSVAAGKTAVLEVEEGGALAYNGVLTSAVDSTFRKAGDGALLLAGDNSASTGAFALDAGSVVLANSAAALGGKITVGSGATLGGVGSAGAGSSVKIAAGGILEAGLENTQSGTLTVHNLEITGDAIVRLDLFKEADGVYQKSDRIIDTGTSAISGVNIIDLSSFASGTFNLGNLAGLATSGQVTLSGMTLPAGGRLSAELSNASGTLELVTTSDQSRVMTWTGSSNSTWNLAETNWSDSGAVNQFSYGDRVLFTAASGNRNIFIDAGEVRVADMTVSGNADYTFAGGGIHADASNVQPDAGGIEHIADATGKLIKTGNGSLTLANGKNSFLGGVEIGGGTLVFNRGEQLTTSDSTGIAFTGNSVLRAAADLELDDAIEIASGVTGSIDSAGHTFALSGTITGTADSTLAKTGEGTVVIASDISGFSGTLAVNGGVLRAGAADVLTAAADAIITVEAGAMLDLAGYDQTLARLQGAGTVELGEATLTMDIDTGGAEFSGGFAGTGMVVKQGTGKWTLSGASAHTGGITLADGSLGLANSAALGAGALKVTMPAAELTLEADGLVIANAIAAGSNMLAIDSNGFGAEFSGDITAGAVSLNGTGTLALSGNNTYANLAVNVPLAIARHAGAISGNVQIAAGSTLEFRDVPTGQVSANLSGDRALFTSSTLFLRGTNNLRTLDIAAGSRITASTVGALSGTSASITVRDGAWLALPVAGTVAGNMSVDGGALVFGASQGVMGSLALSGTLGFSNGGEIRLDGLLPTGIYTAAVAYSGITEMPAYDPHQGGMFMVADIVDDGRMLRITAYNKALEPGKDIAVAFDALSASMRAVYARISEEFIMPLAGQETPRGTKSLWFRAVGSFMEYGDDQERLGYTDHAYTGVIGYDWILTKSLMIGGYFGYSFSKVETSNNATTEMDRPYIGFYAARKLGALCVSADVTMGSGNADTKRIEDFGNTVTGSHKLDTLGASLEISYSLPLFASGEIRPSVGVQYMNLSFYDYEEKGKGAVRLDNVDASLLQGMVKIDANKRIDLPWNLPGIVGLSIGWRQNLRNERTDVWATLVEYPDARLQIRGDKYDKNSVMAGLGIRMMLSKSMLFSLAYDYDCVPFGDQNSGTGRHTFNSMIRISW